MATLYEIDEALRRLEEYGVDEDGVILSDEEFAKLFDEIHMELDNKIENTLCFAKNLDSDVEAFKKEEKSLAERRVSKEKLSARLKANVDRYIRLLYTDAETGAVDLNKLNEYKFDRPKVKISYRKSSSVQILDETKIPKEFITIVKDKKIDKKALKEYLKTHKSKGACISDNVNIQIK